MLKTVLQGRFMHHPLHPLMVHFPIGLWFSSLIFDFAALATGRASFVTTAFYCISLGFVMALLAIPTGLAELLSIPTQTKARHLALRHMTGNLLVGILFLINAFWRFGIAGTVPRQTAIGPILLSIGAVCLLGATGFWGGLLVYDFGIGLRPQGRDQNRTATRAA